MSLSSRDYIRGNHPLSCPCKECTERRLAIFKSSVKARPSTISNTASKAKNIFIKLCLNLLTLLGLGILIWYGYRLFVLHIEEALKGAIFFIIGLTVWVVIIKLSRNRRYNHQKPGFKLTVFILILIVLIFTFAGVQPFANFKDSSLSTIKSLGSSLSTSLDEGLPSISPGQAASPASYDSPNSIIDQLLSRLWWSGTDQELVNSRSEKLFELTNKERANNGLPPLQRDARLDKLAQEKAENMYNAHAGTSISHSGFDERARIANSFGFRAVAENIAYGGYGPSSFIDMWMKSPGHRANILDKSLTHVGIGIYNRYAVQFFGGF